MSFVHVSSIFLNLARVFVFENAAPRAVTARTVPHINDRDAFSHRFLKLKYKYSTESPILNYFVDA
jgi:hypothetical protein